MAAPPDDSLTETDGSEDGLPAHEDERSGVDHLELSLSRTCRRHGGIVQPEIMT